MHGARKLDSETTSNRRDEGLGNTGLLPSLVECSTLLVMAMTAQYRPTHEWTTFDRAKHRALSDCVVALWHKLPARQYRHLSTKRLNLLVFVCDFMAYAKLGASITGATYMRSKSLVSQCRNKLEIKRMGWAVLTEAQRGVVGDVVRTFAERRYAEMLDYLLTEAPGFVGVALAQVGDVVPYETVFLARPRPLTADEIASGQRVAARLGLSATPTSP